MLLRTTVNGKNNGLVERTYTTMEAFVKSESGGLHNTEK